MFKKLETNHITKCGLYVVYEKVNGEDEGGVVRGDRRRADVWWKGESQQRTHWVVRDTTEHVRDRDWNMVVGNLVLERVYDRVRHRYLFTALERMGFPRKYVSLTHPMYQGAFSRVLSKGHLWGKD